ncbi:hypothetical protein ACFQZZ_15145 [Nocardia sp. GCM10030253]|uniref:hypothetical protein n=1 Tax=Nocardia sp. GCM10030253 TaxID=3273404 RepID=UPI00362C8BE7
MDTERRIRAAGFPRDKSLRAFDFDANPTAEEAAINTLAWGDRIKKRPATLPDRRLRHRQITSALVGNGAPVPGREISSAGGKLRYVW